MQETIKEKCMDEDFDVLHKCTEAYNHDILMMLGIKNWSEEDTRDFLDINDKFFWTIYSCIVETKIKYKLGDFKLKIQHKKELI